MHHNEANAKKLSILALASSKTDLPFQVSQEAHLPTNSPWMTNPRKRLDDVGHTPQPRTIGQLSEVAATVDDMNNKTHSMTILTSQIYMILAEFVFG